MDKEVKLFKDLCTYWIERDMLIQGIINHIFIRCKSFASNVTVKSLFEISLPLSKIRYSPSEDDRKMVNKIESFFDGWKLYDGIWKNEYNTYEIILKKQDVIIEIILPQCNDATIIFYKHHDLYKTFLTNDNYMDFYHLLCSEEKTELT